MGFILAVTFSVMMGGGYPGANGRCGRGLAGLAAAGRGRAPGSSAGCWRAGGRENESRPAMWRGAILLGAILRRRGRGRSPYTS